MLVLLPFSVLSQELRPFYSIYLNLSLCELLFLHIYNPNNALLFNFIQPMSIQIYSNIYLFRCSFFPASASLLDRVLYFSISFSAGLLLLNALGLCLSKNCLYFFYLKDSLLGLEFWLANYFLSVAISGISFSGAPLKTMCFCLCLLFVYRFQQFLCIYHDYYFKICFNPWFESFDQIQEILGQHCFKYCFYPIPSHHYLNFILDFFHPISWTENTLQILTNKKLLWLYYIAFFLVVFLFCLWASV